jgi:hypothetical protein
MAQPGMLGIQYFPHSGEIGFIHKHAQKEIKKNLYIGWKMKYLDNEIFTNELFLKKKKGLKSHKITCVSPPVTF